MDTLVNIINFLIHTFGTLYLAMVVLRFILQVARADFYNPVSQMIVKLTNPLLIPLRKIVPGLLGIDFAAIVLAIIVHLIMTVAMLLVMGAGAAILNPLILLWVVFGVLLFSVHLIMITMIIMAIASFIAPHSAHPILMLIRQMNEPMLTPFRKFVPAAGGLDFSMLFAMIFLSVVRMALYGMIQGVGAPLKLLAG